MLALLRSVAAALAYLTLLGGSASAAEPPIAVVTVVGPAEVAFSAKRDACDGNDVPDAPLRAFRDADGQVVAFGLHYVNRALRGASLDALKIDCRVVLDSGANPDPAAYDEHSWITATWTDDGARVQALVHHEYQAHAHPGRCKFKDYMACWTNTVLAFASNDGGKSFPRPQPPRVVAGFPFKQDIDQGRHRGFFNPSNIFADGPHRYFFAATTGWAGQPSGACLFRSQNPADPASWRAFDGKGFTVAYRDPYRDKAPPPQACKPIAPFPAPVGAVVRHRGSGAFVAVFQAKADGRAFPQSGFYATASRDLIAWDAPRLVLAGKTLYDDPCGAGSLISYPSLVDGEATGRNFDDVGDAAHLYFATLKVEGCAVTSHRDLLRRRVAIKVLP
jgi:hypothetical protein